MESRTVSQWRAREGTQCHTGRRLVRWCWQDVRNFELNWWRFPKFWQSHPRNRIDIAARCCAQQSWDARWSVPLIGDLPSNPRPSSLYPTIIFAQLIFPWFFHHRPISVKTWIKYHDISHHLQRFLLSSTDPWSEYENSGAPPRGRHISNDSFIRKSEYCSDAVRQLRPLWFRDETRGGSVNGGEI